MVIKGFMEKKIKKVLSREESAEGKDKKEIIGIKSNYQFNLIKKNIKEIIKLKNIYQYDLAKDAGMTTCSLSLFLSKNKDIKLTTFLRLLSALDTSYNALTFDSRNV